MLFTSSKNALHWLGVEVGAEDIVLQCYFPDEEI